MFKGHKDAHSEGACPEEEEGDNQQQPEVSIHAGNIVQITGTEKSLLNIYICKNPVIFIHFYM